VNFFKKIVESKIKNLEGLKFEKHFIETKNIFNPEFFTPQSMQIKQFIISKRRMFQWKFEDFLGLVNLG
jgi:hypothetical protein